MTCLKYGRLVVGLLTGVDRVQLLARPFVRDASAPEDVHQPVVPFVAGILVQGTLGRGHRNFRAPWPGPRVGIVNRELVKDLVGAHAGEAFDDVQGGTRSLERGLAE